jgi:RNAse (barnase) inhibitor barstar
MTQSDKLNLLSPDQADLLIKCSERISKLDDLVDTFEDWFEFDGKKLELVAKDFGKTKHKAKRYYNECRYYLEEIETIQASLEGKFWRWLQEKYPRALSTKDMQMYCGAEPEIVQLKQIIVNINFTKGKFEAIIDSLDSAGWMISHITKLRVEQLKDEIL